MDLTKFINKFACDEAYYGDHDFITNSQMGHLKKSPLAYQKYKKHGMPDTNALIFGRAFHWAILEPEKFEEKTHIFVFCKGKADKVKKDCVIDLKTTSSGELHSFKGSAYKYGYNRQSAFYMDGFNKSKFIFIVIEKSSPYNLYIYDCSDQFVESGREEYKYLLDVYKEYFIDETKVPSQYYYKGLL
jgi:hypothetical protein